MKKLLFFTFTITIVCWMTSCKSTMFPNGIDYSKDSLVTDYEISNWAKLNNPKCSKLIEGQVQGYTIDPNAVKEHPALIYMILNSPSIDSKEEKQSWFDLLNQMDYDQTNRLYKILYKERHRSLISYYNQSAYDYAKNYDYDMALKTINKGIKLFPTEANLYDSKGEFLLMKGDKDGALKMWQKVLAIDPDFLYEYGETELFKGLKKLKLVKNSIWDD